MLVGVIGLWPSGDDDERVNVVDEVTTSTAPSTSSSSSSSSSSSTTTTSVPTPAGPTGAISLPTGAPLESGQLVVSRFLPGTADPATHELSVISAIDGSIVRTLDTVGTSEGGISDIAVSADRRTVLATIGTSACTGELVAYAADGTGDRAVYPQFQNPLLIARSPDGSSIAVSGDDDCDGDQTITVWPVDGGVEPIAVFGDGGTAGGGLASDGSSSSGDGPGGPYVASLSYLDPGTLDVVVHGLGAHRVDLDSGESTSLELEEASYLAFASRDTTVRLALVQSDAGLEFGVETEAGIEQSIALDELPLDVASNGGEQVWVAPDRTLSRLLELNVIELRDDVTAVA